MQAVAIPAYLAVRDIGEFYVLAVVFGMAYGGVMPLYAVLAREYFGQAVMGTVLGAATMLSASAWRSGPLGGGWIFDTFGSYAWMYIGSALLGVRRGRHLAGVPDAAGRAAAAAGLKARCFCAPVR